MVLTTRPLSQGVLGGINELLCYEVLCCKSSINVNEYKSVTQDTPYLLAELSLCSKLLIQMMN